MSANILIAFENTISASADGISLSADALIVAEGAKEEAEYGQNLSPPPDVVFVLQRRPVVTLEG